ncbi:phosphatase PAP2 family protein [Kribbella sp. NBC_00359]|uniref:phosphatase PAP2 family protein n=1 Tax=Kribbella sp. NBC_00359 TaxID=2975966 RepID=UPI002E2130BD
MTSSGRTSEAGLRYGVLAASAVVVVAGTVGLIILADAATESDGLAAFDPELTADAVSHRTPVLTAIARTLTFIGSAAVLVPLTVVAALVLWRWTRSWRSSAVLVLAMIVSTVLTSVLKALIGRARPDTALVLGPVSETFAFPSGHTLNSTVFFLTLATLVCARISSRRTRTAILTVAVVLSIGVGLSRVYLGYHWATDVVAGWIVAIVWLVIVLNAAVLIRNRLDGPAPAAEGSPPH